MSKLCAVVCDGAIQAHHEWWPNRFLFIIRELVSMIAGDDSRITWYGNRLRHIGIDDIAYEIKEACGPDWHYLGGYVDSVGYFTMQLTEFETRWRGIMDAIRTLPQPIAEEIIPEITLSIDIFARHIPSGWWHIDGKYALKWAWKPVD
jgi:hypothetical protein